MTKTSLLLALALPCSLALADEKQVTDQQIAATVNSHMAELKTCMKDKGASTGKLIVEFSIQPDGHVSDSKVGHASSNAALDRCIADGFKKWSFPKPKNGSVWLSAYPLTFSEPKAPPKGTLTENEIVSTVQAKTPDVQACLAEATKVKADVSGILEAGIVVSPAGKVTEVNVLSTTTGLPSLDACIVAKAKTWPFPKPAGGGEAAFKYPFKLNIK